MQKKMILKMGNSFPIFLGSNNSAVRVKMGKKGIDLKVIDQAGSILDQQYSVIDWKFIN